MLTVRDITKWFGDVKVLYRVNFTLNRGEILGFAGLVGAGRTETARLIFGADRKDAGEILINGQPVHSASPVNAVEAGIGQTAALIGTSDDFIGYDSACQHIAASLGIPAVTVFAGTNNPRFIRRWSV